MCLFLDALIDAFGISARQVAVIQDQAADALWVASRESNSNDASLTQPYKRESPKTCRLYYGFEIADPCFQGKIIDTAIRQA